MIQNESISKQILGMALPPRRVWWPATRIIMLQKNDIRFNIMGKETSKGVRQQLILRLSRA